MYIAGAGPIGLAAAACCIQLLGAAKVIVGTYCIAISNASRYQFTFVIADYEATRLEQAKRIGAETLHLTAVTSKVHGLTAAIRSVAGEHGRIADFLMKTIGTDEIDVAIDAVGFECNGRHGQVSIATIYIYL